MAPIKLKDANPASKVKGPIRCHKCQLKCLDAEHYISHKCEAPRLNLAMARRVRATTPHSDRNYPVNNVANKRFASK
jgi:hypothetical protein